MIKKMLNKIKMRKRTKINIKCSKVKCNKKMYEKKNKHDKNRKKEKKKIIMNAGGAVVLWGVQKLKNKEVGPQIGSRHIGL